MTPREDYEADRRELSPPWEDVGPETRKAYETGAKRHGKWRGVHKRHQLDNEREEAA